MDKLMHSITVRLMIIVNLSEFEITKETYIYLGMSVPTFLQRFNIGRDDPP